MSLQRTNAMPWLAASRTWDLIERTRLLLARHVGRRRASRIDALSHHLLADIGLGAR
jgi:hypothetical protein